MSCPYDAENACDSAQIVQGKLGSRYSKFSMGTESQICISAVRCGLLDQNCSGHPFQLCKQPCIAAQMTRKFSALTSRCL